MTPAWLVRARWLVVPLALAAGLVGGAGGATLALEQRLARAIPGALAIGALHYNPFTGALLLHDVRAGSAVVGLSLEAATVRARVDVAALVRGRLALRDVHVVDARLSVREAALHTVAAGLAAALDDGAPVSIVGLGLTGGLVRIEGDDGAAPLVLRELRVRLGRLVSGEAGWVPALAAAVNVNGGEIHVTGHPVAGGEATAGYVARLRGRDVDVAALQRWLCREGSGVRLERARGDVDAELLAVAGRLVLSGRARLGPVVAHVTAPTVSALRAEEAIVAVDRFDVAAGAGRLSRLELRSPSLTVRLAPGGLQQVRQLGGLLPDVVVRRLRVSDGAVTLVDRGRRLAVHRLNVAIQARERTGGRGLRLALAGVADGRTIGVERTLRGVDAGLASGLIEIVHAVEQALAQ